MNSTTRSNELPDVEVLGEWDHGISDPISANADANSSSSSSNSNTSINESVGSYQDLKAAVLQAEHVVEGAARVALCNTKHVVEDMVKDCVNALGPDRRHADEEPDEIVDRAEWVSVALLLER